nr:leucine zipper domain-containing protein [Blastococcus sp. TF02-9]
MTHADAAQTPRRRLKIVQMIVKVGWTVSYAATVLKSSDPPPTGECALRTAGSAGMTDRSSRPHRCPRRTPASMLCVIVHLTVVS